MIGQATRRHARQSRPPRCRERRGRILMHRHRPGEHPQLPRLVLAVNESQRLRRNGRSPRPEGSHPSMTEPQTYPRRRRQKLSAKSSVLPVPNGDDQKALRVPFPGLRGCRALSSSRAINSKSGDGLTRKLPAAARPSASSDQLRLDFISLVASSFAAARRTLPLAFFGSALTGITCCGIL